MSEKPKLEKVETRGETSSVVDERVLNRLAMEYKCGPEEEPEWCVWGKGPTDRETHILYWIKPVLEGELVARKIAQLNNLLSGNATAEKTEWNPTLKEKPAYYNDPEYLERVGYV